jgi:pyridinium-3,5-bisthiocarboxylic acid mononucleotide nickel chelatase
MKIAYLDCFAGISGDMFLAALLDAGIDPALLHQAAAAMNLNASLRLEKVDRSGISSLKVHVLEGAHLADAPPHDSFEHQHSPTEPTHQHQPKTQHLHKTSHAHTHEPHTHDHEHTHGRSLTVIRQLIQSSPLAAPVKHTAVHAFELLGASEARIHNVPIDQIHFHEVGAVDAILDIVCASAGIHALAADRWVSSPINVGGGTIDCAHGRFPVPAPATADLLRGLPTYSASIQMELVTPTGAALLRTLVEDHGLTFGPQPAMRVHAIGYGAGTRNPKDFPNVLRLSLGESAESIQLAPQIAKSEPPQPRVPHPSQPHREGWGIEQSETALADSTRTETASPNTEHSEAAVADSDPTEIIAVLETALDDLSPQLLAHVAERALHLGALDVMLTPVLMKKGRPGTLITLLANPADAARFEDLLLRETSTLGVRIRHDRRRTLDRAHTTVQTPYGPIRIKLGTRITSEGGTSNPEVLNANPEYEDCRAAAATHNVPLKQVHQAALAAYATPKPAPHPPIDIYAAASTPDTGNSSDPGKDSQ